MKRKFLPIISLMLTFLIGLIALQFYWISNALKVKENNFDQAVNKSINEVVGSLEKVECVSAISACINVSGKKRICILKNSNNDSLNQKIYNKIIISNTDNDTSHLFQMQTGNDSTFSMNCICLNNPKICPMHCGFSNLKKKGGMKSLGKKIKNLVSGKTNFVEGIVNELLRFEEDIDIKERINPGLIDTFIAQKLNENGLSIDYQFGIYDEENNKFIFCDSAVNRTDLNTSKFKAQLFPNDFFLSPHTLVLNFPNQKKYLLKEMGFVLGTSGILIIGIIFTFVYTLLILFKQKKLSDMKNDFINNMTHEFKTPLSTISLASQALSDPEITQDTERINRLSKVIREENQRLTNQTERILQLATMEKGNIKLDLKQLDMHELINEASSSFEMQIKEKNGEIIIDTNAKNFVIEGDRVHLYNIIQNLIDNAIKYTVAQPDIKITTLNSANCFVLKVSDNGIGMSKESIKNIFDKFYRVPTGNIHDVKGFGLGLCYVQALVKAHNGEINVKSEPNKGSEFELKFPFNQHA